MWRWAPYRRPASASDWLRPRGRLEAAAGVGELRRDLAPEIMIEGADQELLNADAELGGGELQVLPAHPVEPHGDPHGRVRVAVPRELWLEDDRASDQVLG